MIIGPLNPSPGLKGYHQRLFLLNRTIVCGTLVVANFESGPASSSPKNEEPTLGTTILWPGITHRLVAPSPGVLPD